MLVRKAYKFKLMTNRKLENIFLLFAGHCRFAWNKALSMNLHRLKNKLPIMYYQELDYFSKLWKKSTEYGFLSECPSQSIQHKLKDLEKAFKDCFDKNQPNKKLPKFKKLGCGNSFRYPQGFKVDKSRIFLPKVGWVRFRQSREIEGKVKNVTITREHDGWHVSIQVEVEKPKVIHESKSIVGIDMGVVKFVTLSTGEQIEPVNSFKKMHEKLKRSQRALARKVKFSNNWKKNKLLIQKIHIKIANIRRDFLHKTSTAISQKHAMIVMEDLKVSNMSKSAKGTIENPGKSVKAKSGLNRSILDQGWYEFRRQLVYKQQWLGGDVIFVNPKNTSITCPKISCGHKSKTNRVSQSKFLCEQCGYTNNADIVGAVNVLRAGHVQLACGDIGSINYQAQESSEVAA